MAGRSVNDIMVKMLADSSGLDKGYNEAARKTAAVSGTIREMLGGALSFVVGMGAFEIIKKGLDTIRETMIGFNSKAQQAEIAFTSFLGSAEAAATFTAQLFKFAAETPFEFKDVQDASKKFLAFGWAAKDVIPTLTAVGNAVAGLGGSKEMIDRVVLAMGQIQAKGKASAQELMQLAEAGIPAYAILADKLHLTGKQVADIGEQGISADKAIRALVEGMNERFPNMMAKQAESFQGVMSTIKDNFALVVSEMSRGWFNSLTEWAKKVRSFTEDVRTAFQQAGAIGVLNKILPPEWADMVLRVGRLLSDMGETGYNAFNRIFSGSEKVATAIAGPLVSALETAWSAAKNVGEWVGDNSNELKSAILAVAAAYVVLAGSATAAAVAMSITAIVEYIAQLKVLATMMRELLVIKEVGTAVEFLGLMFPRAAAGMTLMMGPIGAAAVAIGALVYVCTRDYPEAVEAVRDGSQVMIGEFSQIALQADEAADAIKRIKPPPKIGAKELETGAVFDKYQLGMASEAELKAARGVSDLAKHQGQKGIEFGDDGKKAEELAKKWEKAAHEIEQAWAQEMETSLQLVDRWKADQIKALDEYASKGIDVSKQVTLIEETAAAKRKKIIDQQAADIKKLRDDVVESMKSISDQTAAFNATGINKIFMDIKMEKDARVKAVDDVVKKWQDGQTQIHDKYGNLITDEVGLTQWAEDQKLAIKQQAAEKWRQLAMQYFLSGQNIEEQLEMDKRNRDLVAYTQHLNDKNATFLAQVEGEKQYMDVYRQMQMAANRSMVSYMAEAYQTLYTGLTQALTGVITGTMKASDAFKQLGKSILSMLAQWIAQQIVSAIIGKSMAKMASKFAISQAAVLAAAWEPAALFAATATMGGAAAVGTASLAAGMLVLSALSGGMIGAAGAIGSAGGGSDPGGGESAGGSAPFARGGPIMGPGTGTSDSIPIWASAGEFMVTAAATNRVGLPFLNALNAGKLPRFARGGLVTKFALTRDEIYHQSKKYQDMVARGYILNHNFVNYGDINTDADLAKLMDDQTRAIELALMGG